MHEIAALDVHAKEAIACVRGCLPPVQICKVQRCMSALPFQLGGPFLELQRC